MSYANRARRLAGIVAGIALLGPAFLSGPRAAAKSASAAVTQQREKGDYLKNEVRHQLLLLPYYSIFDNLEYSIDGSTVTLEGQVIHSTLKDDAASVVKKIEGVEKVVNNIEILPPSPNDDQIRRAEFRAIYGFASLEKYATNSQASIHIIVKGGHVTLEGVVDNQADKDTVNIRANGVPDVFSVQNNLKVVK